MGTVSLMLISLITCSVYCECGALHLSGSWNSKNFYLFLTKFGFQKTDPKELESTQGFIYGNITTRGPINSTNSVTLVVVDSEYFLELYGNSTLPSDHACPVMFNKIDSIAFDHDCKSSGKQDFLRKVPCAQGKLCVDEDNPKNVVPGYQFTYKVRDEQRPRFWYISLVACSRDSTPGKSHCQWHSSSDIAVTVDYNIWLVNGDPSVKGLNPFEHQFSFEFHDVFEIHLIALVLCIIIFLLWLYAFSGQRHICTRIFTACLCGEMLSITLTLTHVSIYSVNGVGVSWLGQLGELLDLAMQCLFMLLLLLLAKGLGITTNTFKWKSLIFSLWAAYTLLNVILYIWNLVETESVISNTPEWQSIPGYATLVCRLIVMVCFLLQLRHTFARTDREDLSFVEHFGAFYLVWFCYLPILALVTSQVSPLWRYKTILSIDYAVDILAYTVLVHLFWPARSMLILVEGERPLQTYDLEITGLLDDMQETTLFNREDIEMSNMTDTTDVEEAKDDSNHTYDLANGHKEMHNINGGNGQKNGKVVPYYDNPVSE